MKMTIKSMSAILVILLLALGYSCYKWYDYKHKCAQLQHKEKKYGMNQNSLTHFDYLVLSGKVGAYLECNSEFNKYTQGYVDGAISRRDYLLYCYIFTIRDNNSCAAAELISYYLDDLDNGEVQADTAMLEMIERLSIQILNNSSFDSIGLNEYLAAFCLSKLYKGTYIDELKDTALYQKYSDTASKYAKNVFN